MNGELIHVLANVDALREAWDVSLTQASPGEFAEARNGRDLSVHFVRELHQAVCCTQVTYEARNDHGQILQVPLHHGTWKMQLLICPS